MRCDNCRRNDATIFLTEVWEAHTSKVALCTACGERLTVGALSPYRVADLLLRAGADAASFDPFGAIMANDSRFATEAFSFVRDGVYSAVASIARSTGHVTARELLDRLRSLAIERYGCATQATLESWGVTSCEDFGEIVFALIEKGFLAKSPEDKKEDFANGFDFESAFPHEID
jgi:uncharacterized repeat protein (TIGR04138 family)